MNKQLLVEVEAGIVFPVNMSRKISGLPLMGSASPYKKA